MLLLFGMVQSEIQEFLRPYIPAEYLTQNHLVGFGVFLFILSLFAYLIYRNKKKNKTTSYGNRNNYKGGFTDVEEVVKAKKEKRRRGVVKEINAVSDSRSSKKKNAPKRSKGEGRPGVKREINITDKQRSKSKQKEDKKESDNKKSPKKVEEKKNTYQQPKENQKKEWRKKKSDPVDDIISNQSEEKRDILHIGYDPTDKFKQQEKWKYALVKMPGSGSVIRQPVNGKQQIRGYKEEGFQRLLETSLSNDFNISGNALISTGNQTRPYEPDIFLSYLKNERNIFIDIEIDEPYGGVSRNAIHFGGDDDIRDHYFTDRGWIVIRFAEIQVHQQPKRCLGLIAKVINEISPEIGVSNDLIENPLPDKIEQWDQLKAQEWEKENYRENYLNHEFKIKRVGKEGDSAVELSKQDIEVEKKVEPTKYINKEHEAKSGEINKSKWEKRDNRIEFFSNGSSYEIDGYPVRSVMGIVDRLFRSNEGGRIYRGGFESMILKEWDKSIDLRTFIDHQIEKQLIKQRDVESKAFEHFLNFVRDHSHLNTYKIDWHIFEDILLIASTLHYVVDNNDGTVSIYRWGRRKDFVDDMFGGPNKFHPTDPGFNELSHIDDTIYNKCCLEQGICKNILEKNYGITVRNMHLVVMNPEYDNYHKFDVIDYEDEVEHILNAI